MSRVICRCKRCNSQFRVEYSKVWIHCPSCGAGLYIPDAFEYEKYAQSNIGRFSIIGHVLKEYQGPFSTVYIPNGIKAIGPDAFKNCKSLIEVVIPDSVVVIAYNAFENCTNLRQITIPKNVISIQKWAFQNCYNLSKVIIEHGVERIEEKAFYGCENLRSITIPESINFIHWEAFSDFDHHIDVFTTKEWDRKYGKYLPRGKELHYTYEEEWWEYIQKGALKGTNLRNGASRTKRIPRKDEAEEWATHEGFFDYGEYGRYVIEWEDFNLREVNIDYDDSLFDEEGEYLYEPSEEEILFYYEHFDEYDHSNEDYHMDDYLNEESEESYGDYCDYYDEPDDSYEDEQEEDWRLYLHDTKGDFDGPSWDYYYNDDYNGYEYDDSPF